MTRLILHADDLGLHPAINQAIFDAARAGVLTSASLMVNGQAVQAAIDHSRQLEGFGIGLHLNILRGRPLSAPDEIPSLVDSNGLFLNSAFRLLRRGLCHRISAAEVLTEYRRQLGFLLDHGITPTHLDGEKHTHLLLPQAAWAVGRLMTEFGINKVRLINEQPLAAQLQSQGGIVLPINPRQHLKLLLLEYRSRQARRLLPAVHSPEYTFGVRLSGRPDGAVIRRVLAALFELPGNSAVEWMFHPGYPFREDSEQFNREFGGFFLGENRDRERQLLLSPEVIGLARSHQGQLISYRDL